MKFPSVDTKVEKFSAGIKDVNEYNKISNSAASKDFLNKKAVLEHCEEIDRSAAKSEKEFNSKDQVSKVVGKQLVESQMLYKTNDISRNGKDQLFKDILFEVFKNALYLDTEFIAEQYDNLKFLSDSYVDNNGGIKLLENAVKRTDSPLLKNMLTLCESTARKAAQRKMKQVQEDSMGMGNMDDMNMLDFDMDDEEQEEFNYEKGKLGIDQLSDLVKQKVLTVVQDEKQRSEQQEELDQDIQNQLADDQDVDSQEAAKEALAKIAIKQNPVEETTLFGALMRQSYKELLESITVNAANDQNANADSLDDKETKEKVNNDEEDITKDEFNGDADSEYDLEDEYSDADPDSDPDDEDLCDDDEMGLDMDLVMAEAITKYTLMEVAYTTKLEEYSQENVKKIAQSLLR